MWESSPCRGAKLVRAQTEQNVKAKATVNLCESESHCAPFPRVDQPQEKKFDGHHIWKGSGLAQRYLKEKLRFQHFEWWICEPHKPPNNGQVFLEIPGKLDWQSIKTKPMSIRWPIEHDGCQTRSLSQHSIFLLFRFVQKRMVLQHKKNQNESLQSQEIMKCIPPIRARFQVERRQGVETRMPSKDRVSTEIFEIWIGF